MTAVDTSPKLGTAVQVVNAPIHSEEWYAVRAGRLGGSEIAAVVGLSKWESRFSLWHRKRGEVGEKQANKQMTVGTYVEPSILAWWSDQHPEYSLREIRGTWAHEDRPWQMANPDGIGDPVKPHAAPVLVEAKFVVADESQEWGQPGTDEIPPYYLTQVRWYLDVFGLDRAYVAVLFGGQGQFLEYIVDADPADQEWLRTEGRAFLDSVEADERPDIDAHTATYTVIREMHPEIDGQTVTVAPDVRDEWQDTKAALKAAEDAARKATAVLLDEMGEAQYAIGADDQVTFARRQPTGRGGVALYPVKPKKEKKAS